MSSVQLPLDLVEHSTNLLRVCDVSLHHESISTARPDQRESLVGRFLLCVVVNGGFDAMLRQL